MISPKLYFKFFYKVVTKIDIIDIFDIFFFAKRHLLTSTLIANILFLNNLLHYLGLDERIHFTKITLIQADIPFGCIHPVQISNQQQHR